MRFLSLFILCHFPFLVFAHPADLNQDQRISVAELASALALVSDPATKNGGLDDPHFAQAWFIWRSGETYSGNSQLPEPHNWLPAPTAGKSYLSLTKRVCLPLDPIEIIGLSNPTAALTARFRPLHTQEWLSLDLEIVNQTVSFLAPYVPSPWLPTRDIEIEVSSPSQTWLLGHLRLLPIDRSQVDLPGFMDATAEAIAERGQWDPDTTVQSLSTNSATSSFEKLMGYHYAYLKHSAETIRQLKKSPATADTELEILIAEELFALYSGEANLSNPQLPPSAKSGGRPRARGKSSSDCVTINDWTDLVYYTVYRAQLEAAENDESFAKKAQDKALEKLQEGAEKIAKRIASDSAGLAKRAGLFITIPIELHALLSEWDKKTLPKNFTELTYDLRDGSFNTLPLPMPTDSPNGNGSCGVACFVNFEASIKSDTFSMAKYLLDNKVPGPDDLKDLTGGIKGQLVSGVVDYYESDIGKTRQKAIDRTYDEIKEFDYSPPPCTWNNISVPHDSRDPKVIFTSQQGFQLSGSGDNCFEPTEVGRGIIELQIKTTDSLTLGATNLPNTPPYRKDAIVVSDHPRLEFKPLTYSLDDFNDPPKLAVDITNSYENQKLKWLIYDKTGEKVYEELTEVNTDPLSTESRHELEGYPVPSDSEKYPLIVVAESQAKGCIEGRTSPRVSQQASIFYNARVFDLTPTKICRDPGEVITITATPHKPNPAFKVETWEIVRGGGTITPINDTSATFTFPGESQAEITVRATGEDEFVGQGYYSTGPCLTFVQAAGVYGFDPSTLAEGMLFPTVGFSLSAGYGNFQPTDLDSFTGLDGQSYRGAELVTGFGQIITSFDKEVTNPDPASTTRIFETTSSGVALALVNLKTPAAILEISAAQISGNYFTNDELAGDPRDAAFPATLGKADMGNGSGDAEIVTVTPDVYQIHFRHSLTKNNEVDESGLALTWLSNRGDVIETIGPVTDPDNDEEILFGVTIEYPRSVTRPDVNFTASGNIIHLNDSGNETVSLYSSATNVFQKVEVNLNSTVRIPSVAGNIDVCVPLGGAPRSASYEIYYSCCGSISLEDYELIRGSALQRSIITGYTEEGDTGPRVAVVHNYSDDPSLLYCDEQKKKREDHPVPPTDTPKPPPPPKPEPGETPDELDDFFTNSPADLSGPGRFPPPANPLPPGTLASAGLAGTNFFYPFDRTDLTTFSSQLELGSFNATGMIESSRLWLDEETRSEVAGFLTPVLYGSLGTAASNGLFVEREFRGNYYFEFWERDLVNNKFIARTLITLTPDQHVIGLGDVDQDGLLDYLGRDADANVIIWKGTTSGPVNTPTIHLTSQANWIPRAAGVNPDGTTVLISEDPFVTTYRHQILTSTAAISVDLTPQKPDNQSPMSLADFNGDSWPDLVFHFTVSPTFLVNYAGANATTTGSKTFTVVNGGSFALIGLPQSFRD